MSTALWIAGAAYELGEQRCHHLEIERFAAFLAEQNVDYRPNMLGIGTFHRTADIYDIAERSVSATLGRANVSASAIDCVVVSSSNFRHDFAVQNRGLADVLLKNQLRPRMLHAVCGNGCATMLSSIGLAGTLVQSGTSRSTLVLDIEQLAAKDERQRILPYALLSDCAASLVV